MIKKQDGFTLVELMITMVIFVLTIAAASQIFTSLLTQFKQQSKIAETNIEGIVGLELLRYDIEQAGYGLPFELVYNLEGVNYNEASTAPASDYNDAPNSPRALVSGDGAGVYGSDVLVIKSLNVATSATARQWSYITNDGALNLDPVVWDNQEENLAVDSRVIVIQPISGGDVRVLVHGAGNQFFTTFKDTSAAFDDAFEPGTGTNETFLIYGVAPEDNEVALRMPFNRADYYIAVDNTPTRCAPNTGVLVKSIIQQADGERGPGMPLLDCVADMQVVYGLDNNDLTPGIDVYQSDILMLNAEEVRTQVDEVRVYILAHEGQLDNSYTWAGADDPVINITDPDVGVLNAFDLSENIDATTYRHYRWRIYTLILKPYNLIER
ncbi:MAG: prepilin-type N-terminal cleavage/methylation domain-containing protein [Nitrospirota bacterium]|nr:prepilin-type N-terminal cleavage/methylation domain-containing protein [Nitrospirota bacterium]